MSDRKILAALRRKDPTLKSPRAVTFRSRKTYRRKPKHRRPQEHAE